MAIAHAAPNEIISVKPLGAELAATRTQTLIKTNALEVIRLVVPAGKEIPTHLTRGEVTIQCLEGRVAFTAGGKTQDLEAGHMLYLAAREPHALLGVEDASVLVTILLAKE
jgi:quercetin dioxygenase-like cupin family protein